MPLGWALYLPEEWCEDPERRRAAKIPAEVEFQAKPELGVELIEQAAGWDVPRAQVLGDQAYGDNTVLCGRLHDAELEYVLPIGAETKVFTSETTFTVPDASAGKGRPRSRPRPDRDPVAIAQLIAGLPDEQFQTVTFRDGPDAEPVTSRFCFVRVTASNHAEKRTPWPPREEWLIAEWPEGQQKPSDYWISNLPPDSEPSSSRASRGCAGRSSSTTNSSRASSASTTTRDAPTSAGITTPPWSPPPTASSPWSARTQITHGRPEPPPGSPPAPANLQMLDRPLHHLPANHQPRRSTPSPATTRRATSYQSTTRRLVCDACWHARDAAHLRP